MPLGLGVMYLMLGLVSLGFTLFDGANLGGMALVWIPTGTICICISFIHRRRKWRKTVT